MKPAPKKKKKKKGGNKFKEKRKEKKYSNPVGYVVDNKKRGLTFTKNSLPKKILTNKLSKILSLSVIVLFGANNTVVEKCINPKRNTQKIKMSKLAIGYIIDNVDDDM